MERFKIGDRVKAVKPCDGNDYIVGKIGTIVAISDIFRANLGVEFDDTIGFRGHTCCGKGKDRHCWWCPDLILERVPVNEKIVITTDGKITTATKYDGKTVVKTAVAKCSPDDKFDFETGAKIAFDRLIGREAVETSGIKDGGKIVFPDNKYCRDDVLNSLIFCGYTVEVSHDDETKTITFIFWKE